MCGLWKLALVVGLAGVLRVLAVLRFTRWVDEPVDVAIYASTSALGFAFLENVLDFGPGGLARIHGRAFTATVMHMSLTTIASYGLLVGRARRHPRRHPALAFLPWFALAVAVHGGYDFLIVGSGWTEPLRPLALLVLVLAVVAFKNALSNGLSWSPFWGEGTNERVLQHWWYLGLALAGIVLVEWWVLAARFGPTAADLGFMAAALSCWIVVLVLVTDLGVIRVTRHRWLPLLDHTARKRR